MKLPGQRKVSYVTRGTSIAAAARKIVTRITALNTIGASGYNATAVDNIIPSQRSSVTKEGNLSQPNVKPNIE